MFPSNNQPQNSQVNNLHQGFNNGQQGNPSQNGQGSQPFGKGGSNNTGFSNGGSFYIIELIWEYERMGGRMREGEIYMVDT